MRKTEKIKYILDKLEELYPETPIPLNHTDSYTLLIGVVLSAQCTDERVNKTTPRLFELADNPYKMIQLTIEEIEEIIRPCGLSKAKSKALWNLSDIIVREHGGEVPNTFEDLEKLPGVGHKTASVVMSQAFGVAAFPVDTHIHRLAKRWGLTKGNSVEHTERDLKKAFPILKWNKLHLQIIFYGREFCPARGHKVVNCPICHHIGVKEMA